MIRCAALRLRPVFSLALLCALCACSTRPVVVEGPRGDGIWSLNGRLGVSAGHRHGSFTVAWEQGRDKYTIDLLGPLGVGIAHIDGAAGKVTLKLPRHAPLVAATPEALLSKALGLQIPVTPLRYWVRGKPAPGPYQRTAKGFRQQGWNVDYLAFKKGLPVKIRLTRPKIRLLMVVRQWTG